MEMEEAEGETNSDISPQRHREHREGFIGPFAIEPDWFCSRNYQPICTCEVQNGRSVWFRFSVSSVVKFKSFRYQRRVLKV